MVCILLITYLKKDLANKGGVFMFRVISTMAGTVFRINVEVGEQVDINQEIAILESMKMEIPVESLGAGRVKEIKVAEGDFVNEGDELIILE